MDAKTDTKPNLQDLRTHLDNLQKHDKLTRVSVPINKDTELMPLVRWQFRGLQQDQRKGFLFENVTNAKGQKLSGSVAVSSMPALRRSTPSAWAARWRTSASAGRPRKRRR